MLALIQAMDMTEAQFKAVLIKVVVVGLFTMGSSFALLLVFWRNLKKESEAGETKTRMSTFLLLVALVLILTLMSFVVYKLG